MERRPISNPHNRFEQRTLAYDDDEGLSHFELAGAKIEHLDDATRGILARNDSPDVGFEWSVNPYRGCTHACAYCYARPNHEYLGMGAGTDFDTRILVKHDAPALLREAFEKPSWRGDLVMFSGVTDCYQPAEQEYRLTRGCLEVCAAYRNPVGLITKSPLVERDVDVLQELHRTAAVHVAISIPFIDPDNARAIEPWVSSPQRRLQTVARLAKAGVPVGVMIAPIIPGLNDEDIGDVVKAAADAGADHAGYVLLRLPGAVKDVFEERLRASLPGKADKILHRIRETRGGELYDPRFGARGRGEGPYANMIGTMFRTLAKKHGLLDGDRLSCAKSQAETTFRRPLAKASGQLGLFGE
jgi:DNA repair photolyase